MNKNTKIIIAIVAGAILIAGLMIMLSARSFSNQGKYVEVKGLSERIVKSDRAIWPINFEVKSNSSSDLFNQIEQNISDVEEFLAKAGFEESEISVAPVDTYQDTYSGAQYRYNARISMSVYTDKVDLVRSTSQKTLELVQKGIVMNGSYINFEF